MRALASVALLSAALLSACGEPVTRTSPLPVDAPIETISAADIQELNAPQLMARLTHDLEGMAVEFGKVDDRDHLESTLMRLEEVGTDYRTIDLLLEQKMEEGSDDAQAAVAAGRAELMAAHDALQTRADAAVAAHPDMAQAVREGLDKFDFGILARS
jgi:Asp-tRNA(Asn)/Glu-tRNA(Gln) amidotransferase B subunit